MMVLGIPLNFSGAKSWDAGAAALDCGNLVCWRASPRFWCWLGSRPCGRRDPWRAAFRGSGAVVVLAAPLALCGRWISLAEGKSSPVTFPRPL